MFRHLICTLGHHKINRRRVSHDGLSFRTKCARCGEKLVRGENGWRNCSGESLAR